MDTKSERWSGSTLTAHVSGDTEDEAERRIVTNHSYRPPAIQIEADRRKWNSCRTWEDAMRLNAQFFAGRLEVSIDSSFDPMDMENETLHMLLNHIYVVRHHPCRLGKGYTHDGKASITRQMGSCCFMLPYDHKLILPLMVALLGSRRLSTTVVYRGDEDLSEGPLCNFDCNTVQEISCGSSLDCLDPWSPSTTESLEELHAELLEVWDNVRDLDCEALLSAHPALFHVRTREYGTDILSLLSDIVDGELKRHSLGYVSERYKVVRE